MVEPREGCKLESWKVAWHKSSTSLADLQREHNCIGHDCGRGRLGYGTPQLQNDIIQDEMVVSVWHLLHEAENDVIMLTLGVDGQIL